jgi:Synaptobrevin
VKNQMQENIAGMLKNTEKAESLADKSNQLNEQASVFKKRSGDLKNQMRWKNLKMTLILGGLVLGIILIIVVPLVMKAKKD